MSTNKVYYADREYAHGSPERHIAIFEEILKHAEQHPEWLELSESA